jgi:predicted branched-subunit amino acid permease
MSATTFARSAQFAVASVLVGSTGIGVLAGDLVGDPARLGLDAAFPALFLALLVPTLRSRPRVPGGAAPVSDVWTAVVLVGAGHDPAEGLGAVLLGGRAVPDTAALVLDKLAPAMLAALVVTQLVGGDHEIVVDERIGGIAAAGSRSRSGRRSSSPSSSRPWSRRSSAWSSRVIS